MARRFLQLLPCLLLSSIGIAKPLKPDVDKLIDPDTQEAEIRRVLDASKSDALTSYRLHWSPQFHEAPPLIVLAADNGWSRISSSFEDYPPVENPAELFGEDRVAGRIPGLSRPSLAPLNDVRVHVFDRQGNTPAAWKDRGFGVSGYLCDFNNDDTLDLAEVENHDLFVNNRQHEISVVTITTIEANPRMLGQIVFNCRPSDAEGEDDWTVSCEHLDQEGSPVLSFGPSGGRNEREHHQFLIHWDSQKKEFAILQAPEDEPSHRHLRLLGSKEALDSFAKGNGLGYPVRPSSEQREKLPTPQKPYEFRSLKDSPDQDLLSFFKGKPRNNDRFERGSPLSLPENFWHLDPKEAALALVKANSDSTQRFRWQLAVDARPPAAPPTSGWLVFDGSSAPCYSFSTAGIALRFGVSDSWLLVKESNHQGGVGADAFVDSPAYRVQIIPLSLAEGRFLADTIYWMNRIRSVDTLLPAERNQPGRFQSSADGFGTLSLFPDGMPAEKVATGTVTLFQSTATVGTGYDRQSFLNLTSWLLKRALPGHLKDRWQQTDPIEPRSLMTPLKERLAERQSAESRKQLESTILTILRRHASDSIPASVLAELVGYAGEERLVGLVEELKTLQATLKPETAEERELAELDRKFAPNGLDLPFDGEEKPADAKLRQRRETLQSKYEFHPSHTLRKPVGSALRQLRMARDPGLLMKEGAKQEALSYWALKVLQFDYPEIHAEILIERFHKEELADRRSIFRVLASSKPAKAAELVTFMTPAQQRDLAPELTDFELENTPEAALKRVPDLLKILADRNREILTRQKAMASLAKLTLSSGDEAECERLLLRELDDPQKAQFGSTTLPDAVEALSHLPNASKHLKRIEGLPTKEFRMADIVMDAVSRASMGRQDRQDHLLRLIGPRFEKNENLNNDLFWTVLAFDLRSLAPKLVDLATENSSIEDGYGANIFSGGTPINAAGHHFHAARIITALWKETDPETLARMWTALALAERLSGDDRDVASVSGSLESRTKQALLRIPPEKRQLLVEGLITAAGMDDYNAATIVWLGKLAKEGS
ncbi:hypothetical protein KBB96_12810 [Luteolibacter ambystomatis]|uniref:HEAT repeat domain-containing protein n=1 Tax=Luteolibacter ambystomatis TaxID=2824561 RepID=A0A975G6N7_9BACT|nr:hypothetical protein [Luteolibacter ambystomatis]QUE49751.1 hypothetical protein KBB96_12810 [Luteolibacter ambystomatis]